MGDQKGREQRSPPADKELSYERDGRDAYGENNKSKRKAIPLFKARSNRQGRHGAKIAVAGMTGELRDADEAKLQAADFKASTPWKTKSPDIPLGDYLKRKG
ncbi:MULTISPECIES: hypothetical protein [unclassified Mesorhizobium]|uniref:hypothetical protein n=1 Tax=unclassified Mesorhizobium TaxID=325217 RepID=UPI000BB08E2B|nr:MULTISPECIES: hypothetical protein [unclassified Mesorhizobium]PBB24631.1 hypothetical protein CK232_20580 [Mesorhizobium sp. WSM4304]PBB73930.1 hypothetical protein CK227_17920 [Mesorhizobium sp. WSM4308]